MDAIIQELQIAPIISSIVYSLIGVILFVLAFIVLEMITPFSIKKEIEDDQNIALGIIIGSVIIALAIIISAAIK